MNEAALLPVWKALADPTRRRMLDLLRERPRTTGELSESFDVSRFAVMKHLNVLVDAKLVLVRRQGRQRWNHLNAVPLRRVWERWLRPYESAWAASLLRLQRHLESPEGETTMPEMTALPGSVSMQAIEQEVRIDAPREKVFEAMTGDVSAWWGSPYLQWRENPGSVVLEAEPGGHFRENYGTGGGAIWATVTNVKPNERIVLTGAMALSGAVHGVIRIELESDGGATVLKLSHRAIGEITEEIRDMYSGGWSDLLGTRLKTFVETGKKMGIGHEPETD